MIQRRIEHYDSIENLPIDNWFKINETSNLQWVAKTDRVDIKKHGPVLLNAWNKIFDEFIDTFGIPEKMKEIMEVKRDIFLMKAQRALTEDRSFETLIEIEEDKLKKILYQERAVNAGQVKVYVEKYLGFKLNVKETTVKEFYQYVEALNENARR